MNTLLFINGLISINELLNDQSNHWKM